MYAGPAFTSPRHREPGEGLALESKALLAMAGQLEGMEWHPFWQQQGLSSCNWQLRVRCVLDLLWECRRKDKHERDGSKVQAGPGWRCMAQQLTAVDESNCGDFSSKCLLLDSRLLRHHCSEVVELKHSRAHRGHYVCLRLGRVHVVPGGGEQQVVPAAAFNVYRATRSGKHKAKRGAAAAVESTPAVVQRHVSDVTMTVQQALALALHGFPSAMAAGAGRCYALHVPQLCKSQHGKCANMFHMAWGDAAGNALHRKLTQARVHTFHTPPAWKLEQEVHKQHGTVPSSIRAADVHAVARVLSMASPRGSGVGPSASASASASAQCTPPVSPRYRVLPVAVARGRRKAGRKGRGKRGLVCLAPRKLRARKRKSARLSEVAPS
jgi:hypothetical protein